MVNGQDNKDIGDFFQSIENCRCFFYLEDKEAFRTYHIMIVVQLQFQEAFISVKIVRTNMITDKNNFSF